MGNGWGFWDGHQWAASSGIDQAGEVERGKTSAVLAHIPLAGFVLPLVLYLIEKDKNRYVRHHAGEALNLAIVMVLVQFIGFGLAAVVMFSSFDFPTAGDPAAAEFPIAFFGVWLALMLTSVAYWGLGIWGAVQASRGVWFRYPLPFRLIDRDRSIPTNS